ncbi:MAG: excinuclease ABC subunit UvrA [Candidatus Omnitrophica bacterium]|nr:excinuclease ABC subunit UvrA [Candidatus Omnitrophota bacterium]
MSEKSTISIRGAREHNLKGIDLEIPRNELVVITGLSGSGKSSLAFDTLYAEGQRRYVESLSAYARQFLAQLEKPDVDHIDGLPPAIAIEQRTAGSNPRSTVATATEVYDYLRLLYARAGQPHCWKCGKPIRPQSSQEIIERILKLTEGERIHILAPLVRGRKGEYQSLLSQAQKAGFVRVRIDGEIRDLSDSIVLDRKKVHTIEVVVDRLSVNKSASKRIGDSVETALKVGKGLISVHRLGAGGGGKEEEEILFSEQLGCADCGVSLPELQPRMFSFNSPFGACPTCDGLGVRMEFDPELVVGDPALTLKEGAILPWRRGGKRAVLYYRRSLRRLAQACGFDLDTPFEDLPGPVRDLILYGNSKSARGGLPSFEGVLPNLERRIKETESEYMRHEIGKYMSTLPCHECGGARLRKESNAVLVGGKAISDVVRLSVEEAHRVFNQLEWSAAEKEIAGPVVKEIVRKLTFMLDVGLGYLTLDRIIGSLSGGEAQRIRLATQIGSGLVGILYILDEPSIGLHQRDNSKLLSTLRSLRDIGNTVVVVEHDEETIREADTVIDLGPGAGKRGGYLVAAGPLEAVLTCPDSITGQFLRNERSIAVPAERRPYRSQPRIVIKKPAEHNLKKMDVPIPLGVLTCVTGVSGSGKSTLVHEILYRSMAQRLYQSRLKPGKHEGIEGIDQLDKVIVIDQSPIGRTPRSNPATYTGLFSPIRDLMTKLPDARVRGYKAGRFSFNVKGGRCEACQGDGLKKIEMHFLPDIYVHCEVCKGKRFNQQTLEIKYKGHNISDILEMPVEEALVLFSNVPAVRRKLQTLCDVGLGYIELGQPATTLSGGEAQRVKLSSELSKTATGKTLYILDEPTTGLHFADVEKLLQVLHALVDAGNSVVVIEHNLDVIKTADYIVDLGPEGGDLGGKVVAKGSPEEVASKDASHTGKFLAAVLARGKKSTASRQTNASPVHV